MLSIENRVFGSTEKAAAPVDDQWRAFEVAAVARWAERGSGKDEIHSLSDYRAEFTDVLARLYGSLVAHHNGRRELAKTDLANRILSSAPILGRVVDVFVDAAVLEFNLGEVGRTIHETEKRLDCMRSNKDLWEKAR